jgi:hypothetical protein
MPTVFDFPVSMNSIFKCARVRKFVDLLYEVKQCVVASRRTQFLFKLSRYLRQRGEPDYVMAIDAGPELLTGSTRLKAGTATKLVLNILTTLALGVGMDHVVSNLMVNMRPTNEKLKDKAVCILAQLFENEGKGSEECRAALEATNWVIADARQALANELDGCTL